MSTYTPTAVALVDITLPADGENIDAADVNSPLQEIADGVAYVQAQVAVLATLAALTAIATPTDGLVRHVLGHGLYVFKTSATTGLSPFRLAADDATAGGWMASHAHETALTVRVNCAKAVGISCTASTQTVAAVAPSKDAQFVQMIAADANIISGALVTARAYTGSTNHFGVVIPLDDAVIEGATLASATLKYRPNTGHGSKPDRFVNIGVFRAVKTGYATATTALLSTGGGLVADAEAGTAGDFNNNDRSLVWTADQNNVIDKATYRYFAQVWDEAGTNALAFAMYQSLDLAFTTIPDGRR